MLEQLCNADGGLGGTFHAIEVPDDDQPKDIGGFPRWELEEPIGPFTRYSRWSYAPSYKVHTLRYYGRRSPDLGIYELYQHLSPIADAAGWVEVEDFEFGTTVNWHKTVQTDRGETVLHLALDGGMLSMSLYCIDRNLRVAIEADL